jgi:hypothetical protein
LPLLAILVLTGRAESSHCNAISPRSTLKFRGGLNDKSIVRMADKEKKGEVALTKFSALCLPLFLSELIVLCHRTRLTELSVKVTN